MYRNVIEPLAETAYVVAPDLPGFGYSSAPSADAYDYTFENIADTIDAFLAELGLERFFLFIHDFGTPVGYHLATRGPDRILGLIVQNGNAHDEGLGKAWDAPKAFFADPSEENRAKLPDWMNFETTRYQYVGEQPGAWRASILPRAGISTGSAFAARKHSTSNSRSSPTTGRILRVSRPSGPTTREHQPPSLLLWGRHDPFFDINEIIAYNRVLDALEIHVFESGHQLLETHHRECAALVTRFHARGGRRGVSRFRQLKAAENSAKRVSKLARCVRFKEPR